MKLPKKCIICGSHDNLDTSINVKYHGEEYHVYLCTEHEDTTPKAAKTAIGNMLDEIDELSEHAEKYNMVLVTKEEYKSLKDGSSGGPLKTTGKQLLVDQPPQQNISSNAKKIYEKKSDKYGHEGVVKVKQHAPTAAGKIDGTGDTLESNESYEVIKEKQSKVEVEDVAIKGGTVKIPKKIKDGTGTTEIRINQGVDDRVIQSVARRNSSMSKSGSFNGIQYERECTACKGTGIHPMTKGECPKCNGIGLLI